MCFDSRRAIRSVRRSSAVGAVRARDRRPARRQQRRDAGASSDPNGWSRTGKRQGRGRNNDACFKAGSLGCQQTACGPSSCYRRVSSFPLTCELNLLIGLCPGLSARKCATKCSGKPPGPGHLGCCMGQTEKLVVARPGRGGRWLHGTSPCFQPTPLFPRKFARDEQHRPPRRRRQQPPPRRGLQGESPLGTLFHDSTADHGGLIRKVDPPAATGQDPLAMDRNPAWRPVDLAFPLAALRIAHNGRVGGRA